MRIGKVDEATIINKAADKNHLIFNLIPEKEEGTILLLFVWLGH